MFEELRMDTVSLQINVTIEPDVLQILSTLDHDGNIHLEKGKWKLYRIGEISQWIQIWKIRDALYLQENSRPTILKEIRSIAFPYLRKLHFWGNNIESLEDFGQTMIPNLQFLQFCDNNIMSFKSFRKCYFPKLKFLQFCSNKGKQLTVMGQLWAPSLNQIILEMYEDSPSHCQSLSWVFKMQSKLINEIWARSGKRIPKKGITERIQRRYPNINLFQQKL